MKYVNKKTRIIILSTIILTIIATMGYITYGYVSANVVNNESGKKVVLNGQVLRVKYSGGTESLENALIVNENGEEVSYFKPGTTLTKTFTIKNTGNKNLNYSIRLKDVINDFERTNDLTYEIKNGEEVLESGVFPNTDTYLMSSDSLSVNESKTYTLVIKYLTSEENQIVDSGKTISGIITIEEATQVLANLKIYGNSIQDGTPSPDAPIEIESLGDRTKNLFNTKIPSRSGAIVEENENEIKIRQSYNKSVAYINYGIEVKKNTNYTLSLDFQMFNPEMYSGKSVILVRTGNASGGVLGQKVFDVNNDVQSVKINFNSSTYETVYIWLYFQNQVVELESLDSYGVYSNIQLEEGDTATDYEPYGYKIPIDVRGKNLVNVSDMNVSFTNSYYENYFPNSPKLLLLPNTTYTISFDYKINSASNDVSLGIGYGTTNYSADIVSIYKFPNQNSGRLNRTFTTPSTFREGFTPYLQLRLARLSVIGNIDVDISNVQVEYGDEATTYSPYIPAHNHTYYVYTSAPLRKIGDNTDYLDFENNKVVRNIKTHSFNTNDYIISYTYGTTLDNTYHFYVYRVNGDDLVDCMVTTPMYSNIFPAGSITMTHNANESFFTSKYAGNNGWIYIQIEKALIDGYSGATIEDKLKAYLQEKNTYVNYVSNSSNDTEKIKLDGNLPRIELFEENSNISVCSTNGVCASSITYE